MPLRYIPPGRSTISPYLICVGVDRLIEFLKTTFDAVKIDSTGHADGITRNAELKIDDTVVMLSEAPDRGTALASAVHVYVPDVDATYQRALDAGATPLREPENQFYGERVAAVLDPCGNQWWLATRVERLSAKELAKRIEAQRQPR